jgi:hypothetical protein
VGYFAFFGFFYGVGHIFDSPTSGRQGIRGINENRILFTLENQRSHRRKALITKII